MAYTGLRAAEISEIRRLNQQYLGALATNGVSDISLKAKVGKKRWEWFVRAKNEQLLRLSTLPYLLFRLDTVNAHLASPSKNAELFAAHQQAGTQLLSMATAFAHQLAQRDLFSLRVITGATEDWCHWLQGMSLVRLSEIARSTNAPIVPILGDNKTYWPELFDAARFNRPERLQAVAIAGMQHLISRQSSHWSQAIAARSAPAASRRVAER